MTIEKLEERVGRIQAELDEAERKLESWQAKKQAALSEFEAALDEGDESPHDESSVLSECRFAVNHFEARVADRKKALKQARRALAYEEYEQGVVELRKARAAAGEKIAAVESQFVSQALEYYETCWALQEAVNSRIERFNTQLAGAVGERTMAKLKHMNGLSDELWVERVLRQALHGGKSPVPGMTALPKGVTRV
jgi:hypothetical protein